MKNGVLKYFLISLGVIILDHVVKLLVHFNMVKGSSGQIPVFGDWFKLHYLTNPGMAFGMELPFENSKMVLTLFRVIAMVAIGYYLYYLHKKDAPKGLLICIGLILGGAIGNLVDSIFYGVFLDNAPYDAPSPWFYGQVMIHPFSFRLFLFSFIKRDISRLLKRMNQLVWKKKARQLTFQRTEAIIWMKKRRL